VNANADTVISYQIPAIVLAIAAIRHFAPHQYHPLATTAHGILQAFRLLPVVLATLVRPHGHAFKVTPKGGDRQSVQDRLTVFISLSLCGLIALGLYINSSFNAQIVPHPHLLPVVAAWAMLNMVLLLLVAKIAITPPMLRGEERFELREPVTVHLADRSFAAESLDVSLNGIRVAAQALSGHAIGIGDWAAVEISGVGKVPAQVRRIANSANGAPVLSFSFPLSQRDTAATVAGNKSGWQTGGTLLRRRLIRKLYTTDRLRVFSAESGWKTGFQMLASIFRDDNSEGPAPPSQPKPAHAEPPSWLHEDRNEAADDLHWQFVQELAACRKKDIADDSAA
jgi:cellulose synthase (UDP-forming)